MTSEYFGKQPNTKDGFRKACKECRHDEYMEKQEVNIARSHKYYNKNKKHISQQNKKYKEEHADFYKQYDKEYYQNNKEKIKKHVKEYMYNRIETDISYKILQRCRSRLYKAVKGYTKSASTQKLIGCTPEELIIHIEQQFQEGMSWDNYGKWHIDHIIPCAAFDFSKKEEQLKCFNYTNLQPLWAKDNFSKHDKIMAS